MTEFELTPGCYFDLKKENMTITEDFTVLKDNFPIGSLKDNLKWFKESETPKISDIDKIVYLGKYTWGIRHFTSKLSEFNLLSDSDKESILEKYLSIISEY